MITVTGWTWEYIDEHMTFPRLSDLSAYWQQHPPTHIVAAVYAGIKPAQSAGKGKVDAVPDFTLLPDEEE